MHKHRFFYHASGMDCIVLLGSFGYHLQAVLLARKEHGDQHNVAVVAEPVAAVVAIVVPWEDSPVDLERTQHVAVAAASAPQTNPKPRVDDDAQSGPQTEEVPKKAHVCDTRVRPVSLPPCAKTFVPEYSCPG